MVQVVDAYSRRLQTPERLARQIGELLQSRAAGVAVRVESSKTCRIALDAAPTEPPEPPEIADFATGSLEESATLWERFLAGIS